MRAVNRTEPPRIQPPSSWDRPLLGDRANALTVASVRRRSDLICALARQSCTTNNNRHPQPVRKREIRTLA